MKGRVTSVEAMPVKLDFGGEKSLLLLCGGKTDCYAVCGDHRKVVEGIVTRRKWDKTASFNPLSHGFAVTAPLINKWSLRVLNNNLAIIHSPPSCHSERSEESRPSGLFEGL